MDRNEDIICKNLVTGFVYDITKNAEKASTKRQTYVDGCLPTYYFMSERSQVPDILTPQHNMTHNIML